MGKPSSDDMRATLSGLRHDRYPKPVVDEHVREVEPGKVTLAQTSLKLVWRAIASEYFYPAPSLAGCAWCGYRKA